MYWPSFLRQITVVDTVQIYAPLVPISGVYLVSAYGKHYCRFNVHKLVAWSFQTTGLYTLAANTELFDQLQVAITIALGDVL